MSKSHQFAHPEYIHVYDDDDYTHGGLFDGSNRGSYIIDKSSEFCSFFFPTPRDRLHCFLYSIIKLPPFGSGFSHNDEMEKKFSLACAV